MSFFTVCIGLFTVALNGILVKGCSKNATAVSPFNVTNYLGVWYEIAVTQEFREVFEEGLVCTTAEYSLNDDGTIKVDNFGYEDSPSGDEKEAIGTAKQAVPDTAELEVSFYGPFYSPYWVIHTINDDEGNYNVALVWSCSNDETFLQNVWILGREHSISDDDYNEMYNYAINHGIDLNKLNITKTDQTDCDDYKYNKRKNNQKRIKRLLQ